MLRRIQVPGKLVLIGEYAVLDGAPAWVAAVDRGVTCEVWEGEGIEVPQDDRFVRAALGWDGRAIGGVAPPPSLPLLRLESARTTGESRFWWLCGGRGGGPSRGRPGSRGRLCYPPCGAGQRLRHRRFCLPPRRDSALPGWKTAACSAAPRGGVVGAQRQDRPPGGTLPGLGGGGATSWRNPEPW